MKIRLYGGDYDRQTLDTRGVELKHDDLVMIKDHYVQQPYRIHAGVGLYVPEGFSGSDRVAFFPSTAVTR